MALTPKAKVLLRRRGPWEEWPWFSAEFGDGAPRASPSPDEGWRVHDAGDGAVLLESLTVPKARKSRWLFGQPGKAVVRLATRTAGGGLLWKPHPAPANTFLLECLGKGRGPKWLALPGTEEAVLTERPAGRSMAHEFVALPRADLPSIVEAQQRGDYSYLSAFAVGADGRPADLAPAPRPEPPAGTLTPRTPRERAGGDPVALELVEALQPSFDDGGCGAEYSDYPRDDPRQVGWPHNIISLDTVATPTGIVRLAEREVGHRPPPGELERCRALAREVASALGELRPFGGDSPTPFRPFYLVIGEGDPVSEELTPEVVEAAFRGTIFPETPIDVRPVLDPDFAERAGEKWAGFIAWVRGQQNLKEVSYVVIGYDTAQEPNYAAVFPRLVLGLTRAGSLAGACGAIVQA